MIFEILFGGWIQSWSVVNLGCYDYGSFENHRTNNSACSVSC
jgi:hypothetical protein